CARPYSNYDWYFDVW
nr:immunoglobulin heavy chain junction region [Mus musculus]